MVFMANIKKHVGDVFEAKLSEDDEN